MRLRKPLLLSDAEFRKDLVDDPFAHRFARDFAQRVSAADRSTAATSSGMPSSIAVTASQSAARARPAASTWRA